MSERIVFSTNDHVEIVGTYTPVPQAQAVVLCLHMMPDDRTSWALVQEALAQQGLASLAIDLRGHGDSTRKGDAVLDFRVFADADHQQSAEDVRGALAWLVSKGFRMEHVGLMGASIGANLALRAMAEFSPLPVGVLLSPGANYRGITSLDAVTRLRDPQAIFVAASAIDDQVSFEDAKTLVARASLSRKRFAQGRNIGHGVRMFSAKPALLIEAIEWLTSHT
ncbi:MAG: alpha/beta fold hydrolase [Patescibacteria group bacterium]